MDNLGYVYNVEYLNGDSIITGYDNKIFYSVNGGISWLNITSPSTIPQVIIRNPTFNKNICTHSNYAGINNIYLSTNFGNNWNVINYGINSSVFGGYFSDENTGYIVGGYIGFIMKSVNKGFNWNLQYTSNQTEYELNGIFMVNSNTGYAYGKSILKTTNGGEPIGIHAISTEIPKDFAMEQNYPNPFNPSTKIRFSLPERSFARLVIYDALGREITGLVNEELNSGVYETEWQAENYPSGIYFYRLVTDKFTETMKMILIK